MPLAFLVEGWACRWHDVNLGAIIVGVIVERKFRGLAGSSKKKVNSVGSLLTPIFEFHGVPRSFTDKRKSMISRTSPISSTVWSFWRVESTCSMIIVISLSTASYHRSVRHSLLGRTSSSCSIKCSRVIHLSFTDAEEAPSEYHNLSRRMSRSMTLPSRAKLRQGTR